jgi:hypothetical protein
VGYRDRGDRSREGRDRRPSSAAEFGDATIDRPSPLDGRRGHDARPAEQTTRQSDRPAPRIRSDAAGWATITPADDPHDEEPWADRGYSDDGRLPTSESESESWRGDDGPVRSYQAGSRHGYDSAARSGTEEPRRSRRSIEEGPRRSRRAAEESARHDDPDAWVGTRAIGPSETDADPLGTDAQSAELETWRSDTGTWRTRDPADTGSWRLPATRGEVLPSDGDTGWGSSTTPETGTWSRSEGRWVARIDDTGEQADFTVRRYDDTGEIPKHLVQALGDDAPDYRAGRRGAGGSRAGRHSSDGHDSEDQWPPARADTGGAPVYSGPRGSTDSAITPRAYPDRGGLVGVGRLPDLAEQDEDDVDEVPYGYARAGFASVAWFGLPIGAFLLWAVLLGGTARANCVDAGGRPCPAPRDTAFATFAAHLPQVGVAIVLSILVALLIRLMSPFWRPATVGFAASVVGGGIATVLFTIQNGG